MKTTIHDVDTNGRDRAVLVSLVTDELKREELYDPEHSLDELISLAETAGVDVAGTMSQNKDRQDNRWFIGKGKAEELKAMLQELDANTAIFDQELSGAQVRNLEEYLDVKIIDRTQLILDIFAQRAKTREGRIQVELAQLSYLLPRLSGHGANLSRLGGGIGTRGPGESKLETDRRHIRNRIAELRRQLTEVVKHRKLHRERRKETGVFQAALVGYTNAGKSTLLRQLTAADVYVENQLFATLDPTSRALTLPGGQEIVLTDTVGFIQNLPHDLVAAFRATLEEANEADLIIHVVDSSSPMMDAQMKVVDAVLEELGAHGKERLTLYNKADLVASDRAELLSTEGEFLKISAYEANDIDRVIAALEKRVTGGNRFFRIPADRGDLVSLAYRVGEVLDNELDGEDVLLTVRVNKRDFEKLGHKLAAYDLAQPIHGIDRGETTDYV